MKLQKNKIATISAVVILVLSAFVCLSAVSTAQSPDYEQTWVLDEDGSEDESDYYNVTRADDTSEGELTIRAWEDNTTIRMDFTNIESVELYLEETEVDIDDYRSFLNAVGGEVTIIVATESVSTMDFLITGIPEFAEAQLNGGTWDAYNYDSSTNTMDFDLDMSENEITLIYGGWLGDVISLVVVVAVINIIFKSFKGAVDDVAE